MNIEDIGELRKATPCGFISLNDECHPTNTAGGKPYDHVMYSPKYTKEIDCEYDLCVVDLIQAMKPFWKLADPYPGCPYDHNEFRKYFSDHHPIVFRILDSESDDDGVESVILR